MKHRHIVAAVGLVAAAGRPAAAHEQAVHQQITAFAYEIMRLADADGTFLATPPAALPPGVTAADWTALRQQMIDATLRLRSLDPALDPIGHDCEVQRNPLYHFTGTFNQWTQMRQVDEPLGWTYPEGRDCGVMPWWLPGGIFTANSGPNNDRDYTGLTLGMFAANVDDEFEDTHIWFKPTNVSAPGAPTPSQVLDDAVDAGLIALLAPFVCLVDILSGNGNCLDHANDIADAANPIDDLIGSLPGIGDVSNELFVGFWHHINVAAGRSNEFDDVQGMFLDEGTYAGTHDPFQLGLIALADISGMSLDANASHGTHNYQIGSPRDGHAATQLRSRSKWEYLSYAHIAMSPIDNLALFGWERFKEDPAANVRFIGWPLHALGDAAEPHHTIGTPGWGHRPFEIRVNEVWNDIRFNPSGPSASDLAAQRAQAARIFTSALRYRKLIRDWRALDPTRRKFDLPIRDLVTQVARETLAHANAHMPTDLWPFDPAASTLNLAGGSLGSYARTDFAALTRPLIENATAATIAFLTFASEVN